MYIASHTNVSVTYPVTVVDENQTKVAEDCSVAVPPVAALQQLMQRCSGLVMMGTGPWDFASVHRSGSSARLPARVHMQT